MFREGFANSCSNDDSGIFEYIKDNTYKENLDRYRSTLTERERSKFDNNRQKTYKKTFWICVIYAVIALSILLIGIFSQWGNNVFFNELFPFVITYIIGTIVIISLLTWSIYSFDFPEIKKKLNSDANYCPDYWDNIYNEPEKGKYGSQDEHLQFNVKCKIDTNTIYKPSDLDVSDLDTDGEDRVYKLKKENNKNNTNLSDDEYKKFRKIMAKTSGYKLENDKDLVPNEEDFAYATDKYSSTGSTGGVEEVPFFCNNVFPKYMAIEDLKWAEENKSDKLNTFRCAYSKLCKIPWTEAGCN